MNHDIEAVYRQVNSQRVESWPIGNTFNPYQDLHHLCDYAKIKQDEWTRQDKSGDNSGSTMTGSKETEKEWLLNVIYLMQVVTSMDEDDEEEEDDPIQDMALRLQNVELSAGRRRVLRRGRQPWEKRAILNKKPILVDKTRKDVKPPVFLLPVDRSSLPRLMPGVTFTSMASKIQSKPLPSRPNRLRPMSALSNSDMFTVIAGFLDRPDLVSVQQTVTALHTRVASIERGSQLVLSDLDMDRILFDGGPKKEPNKILTVRQVFDLFSRGGGSEDWHRVALTPGYYMITPDPSEKVPPGECGDLQSQRNKIWENDPEVSGVHKYIIDHAGKTRRDIALQFYRDFPTARRVRFGQTFEDQGGNLFLRAIGHDRISNWATTAPTRINNLTADPIVEKLVGRGLVRPEHLSTRPLSYYFVYVFEQPMWVELCKQTTEQRMIAATRRIQQTLQDSGEWKGTDAEHTAVNVAATAEVDGMDTPTEFVMSELSTDIMIGLCLPEPVDTIARLSWDDAIRIVRSIKCRLEASERMTGLDPLFRLVREESLLNAIKVVLSLPISLSTDWASQIPPEYLDGIWHIRPRSLAFELLRAPGAVVDLIDAGIRDMRVFSLEGPIRVDRRSVLPPKLKAIHDEILDEKWKLRPQAVDRAPSTFIKSNMLALIGKIRLLVRGVISSVRSDRAYVMADPGSRLRNRVFKKWAQEQTEQEMIIHRLRKLLFSPMHQGTVRIMWRYVMNDTIRRALANNLNMDLMEQIWYLNTILHPEDLNSILAPISSHYSTFSFPVRLVNPAIADEVKVAVRFVDPTIANEGKADSDKEQKDNSTWEPDLRALFDNWGPDDWRRHYPYHRWPSLRTLVYVHRCLIPWIPSLDYYMRLSDQRGPRRLLDLGFLWIVEDSYNSSDLTWATTEDKLRNLCKDLLSMSPPGTVMSQVVALLGAASIGTSIREMANEWQKLSQVNGGKELLALFVQDCPPPKRIDNVRYGRTEQWVAAFKPFREIIDTERSVRMAGVRSARVAEVVRFWMESSKWIDVHLGHEGLHRTIWAMSYGDVPFDVLRSLRDSRLYPLLISQGMRLTYNVKSNMINLPNQPDLPLAIVFEIASLFPSKCWKDIFTYYRQHFGSNPLRTDEEYSQFATFLVSSCKM